jgi:hypothetical protein
MKVFGIILIRPKKEGKFLVNGRMIPSIESR